MKIATYNPAKNKKLFLGLWFVAFIVLVLLFNWLFNIPVMKTNNVQNRFDATDLRLTRLKAIYAEFIIGYVKKDNLFTVNVTEIENEAKALIGQVKGDLNYYKTVRYLSRENKIAGSLNELSDRVTNVENNLNDFFLASHERGDESTGLVFRWQEVSTRMLTACDPSEEEIISKLNLIKQLEANYLLHRDLRVMENISNVAEEIRNLLTFEMIGIDIAYLDIYMALTGNLIALDKRIGNTESQGITVNLENSMQKLTAAFQNSTSLVTDRSVKIRKWWNISWYIAILVLTSLCIFFFIRIFSKLIFQPLSQIAGVTSILAQGVVPEDYKANGKLANVHTINESIKSHISALHNKINFAKAINKGVLDTQLQVASEQDILGNELIQLRNGIVETVEKQVKNDEENLIRRYMNEGLAKFGDLLRTSSNDMIVLGDIFIREMVKYLNAIQGGFFIFDDSNKTAPVLNLVSAFAYNRKKYMQKSVAYGEGLVGTCAREKQYINLIEIPADYISITSGLGDTLPDNLLLVPVLHENELIGVLEIASLNKYKDYEITFAQEVALSLGSTIIYTRNNQRTSDLLAKSQQQALEMAEQEEEMRQNMEELKATQEESTRREEELRGVATAVNNTMYVVEYDLNGMIGNINNKLSALLNNDLDDVVGKTHHEIFKSTLSPDQKFWKEIQKKNQVTVYENIKVGRKTIRLKEHFTAIMNRENTIIKYINFATDDRAGDS